MTYLDTSAVVKLAIRESETRALVDWILGQIRQTPDFAASRLVITEARRALKQNGIESAGALELVLSFVDASPVDAMLEAAGDLPGQHLRSLDAIHLATAEAMKPDWFVSYDKRLCAAAEERGLNVIAPA